MQVLVFVGAAKSFDHGCVVHSIWLMLARIGCGAWIERVPTKDNISDLPSRLFVCAVVPFEHYVLLAWQGKL